MFSSRLSWDLTPNRLSEALEVKRASEVEVLDLTESNPTRAGFKYDEAEILSAMAQPQSMLYQPTPRGLPKARRAIAEYYKSRASNIDPDSIFLTASTSEAYAYLFKLLGDPGDEVLAPQPSYPLLDFLTALESLKLTRYPLQYDYNMGWQIDFEALRASISDRAVTIVAVSPNNPTGSCLKKRELDELNDLCDKHGLALIVDEVFSDYVSFPPHPDPLHRKGDDRVETAAGNKGALTFVLSGLSKVLGLPQLKLGWIQVSGPEGVSSEARSRLELIADTYLSVATTVQHAVERLLPKRDVIQRQIVARTEENGSFLEKKCSEVSGCRVLIREGGWYSVVKLQSGISDDQMAHRLLMKDNVIVHPGYFYDFPDGDFLVLSLLTPIATFREGISRLFFRLNKL
jgi:aspartate/methionine/tyrosine aminotransferase